MRAAAVLIPIVFLAGSALLPSRAQTTCQSYSFPNRSFATCTDLGALNAKLHWTYNPANRTVTLAFRAPPGGRGYVAWGLNPSRQAMAGTQALVAVQNSSTVWSYTTNIDNTSPDMKPATLSTVRVSNLLAESKGDELIIYATVTLPGSTATQNHVWQASTTLSDNLPGYHGGGQNLRSVGSINFQDGVATSTVVIPRKKKVHGVLNAVAWGTLMPIGAILARYLKVFKSADPAWFYLHVTCQCSAYGLGVAGWATGLKLGSDSPGVTHKEHRIMGIALFCMATLQVFALFLRPDKNNKYRIFWNVYHHFIGYSTIVLSIINIFEGFDILDNPEKKWKNAYIGVISTLAGIALVLEVVTWIIVIRRRRSEKSHHGQNGALNGYGSRV